MKSFYENNLVKLYKGDCLEIMPQLDIKFDACITDLPYGTTQNSWDSIIPFDDMWNNLNNLIKENGAIILFGQDKFSAKLMLSNEKNHKYNLIWKKGERASGFLNAKKMPLRNHEDILVFYRKQPSYIPQMTLGKMNHSKGKLTTKQKINCYGKFNDIQSNFTELKYPKSILNFDRPHPPIHPTQKPVELLEWLIKTYTNENEIILDFTAGSGTTGVACMNLNRKCILIEKDENYCEIIKDRLNQNAINELIF
jgi:site-specific DNA-methyltransferase (adenine-specific)